MTLLYFVLLRFYLKWYGTNLFVRNMVMAGAWSLDYLRNAMWSGDKVTFWALRNNFSGVSVTHVVTTNLKREAKLSPSVAERQIREIKENDFRQ